MKQSYAAAGIEPPLEELLNDPITRLLMQRDGIGVADVRRAVAAGRLRLWASAPDSAQELGGLKPTLAFPSDVRTRAAPDNRPGAARPAVAARTAPTPDAMRDARCKVPSLDGSQRSR